MTAALTQTVKVTVGRPRPGEPVHLVCTNPNSSLDLISRCQPGLAPSSGLVTAAICTQTDIGKLKDGFRSFWSGHASCKQYFGHDGESNTHVPSSVLCWTWVPQLVSYCISLRSWDNTLTRCLPGIWLGKCIFLIARATLLGRLYSSHLSQVRCLLRSAAQWITDVRGC